MTVRLENITPEHMHGVWDTILYATGNASNKRCFIGGGAIRDLLLGKPVKDIDVFYEETLNLEKLQESLGGDAVTARETTNYDGRAMIIHDWEGRLGKLDFIQVDNIVSRKLNFAASISTVFYSLPLGLQITFAFLNTIHAQKIEFYSTATRYYYDKISAKYPKSEGWTYHGHIVQEIEALENLP